MTDEAGGSANAAGGKSSAGDTGAGGGGPAGGSSSASGGSGEDGGAPSIPDAAAGLPLADLPAAIAAAACSALDACLGAAAPNFFRGIKCADVLVPATKEGSLAVIPSLVDSGKIVYDDSKVASCLDTIKGAACTYPNRRQNALCPGVLTGTVATGGECVLNAECAGDAYCKVDGACPGHCAALVSAGGACTGDDDCVDGLTCNDSKKCAKPGKAGDACSAASPCGDGFTCVASKCVTLLASMSIASGATCDPKGETACKPGLTCALTALDAQQKGVWKCEPSTKGPSCHVALPEQCPAGQYCELPDALTGTCKKAPLAGAACASYLPTDPNTEKNVCGVGLTCGDDGKCHALAHLDDPCTVDSDCYSGACRAGTCVAGLCAP